MGHIRGASNTVSRKVVMSSPFASVRCFGMSRSGVPQADGIVVSVSTRASGSRKWGLSSKVSWNMRRGAGLRVTIPGRANVIVPETSSRVGNIAFCSSLILAVGYGGVQDSWAREPA